MGPLEMTRAQQLRTTYSAKVWKINGIDVSVRATTTNVNSGNKVVRLRKNSDGQHKFCFTRTMFYSNSTVTFGASSENICLRAKDGGDVMMSMHI